MKMFKHHDIIIIGAGIGGLALANGLQQKGLDFAIYERDLDADTRNQGYRLTINPDGDKALKELLPANHYNLLADTSGKEGYAFTIYSRKKRIFHQQQFPQKNDNTSLASRQVDREILRAVLFNSVIEKVVFGKTFASYKQENDLVTVKFNDGSTATCNILVGADGANSKIRIQLFPNSPVQYLGINSIYCRTPFILHGKSLLAEDLVGNGLIAMSTDIRSLFWKKYKRGLFMTSIRFKEHPGIAKKKYNVDLKVPDRDDYIMWAVIFPEKAAEQIGYATGKEGLYDTTVRLLKGYHPDFLKVVRNANIDDTLFVPFRISQPLINQDKSNRITLMGDAMHVMPPTGAHGANTALMDALSLCNELIENFNNDCIKGLRDYESKMVEYANEARNDSLSYIKKLRF